MSVADFFNAVWTRDFRIPFLSRPGGTEVRVSAFLLAWMAVVGLLFGAADWMRDDRSALGFVLVLFWTALIFFYVLWHEMGHIGVGRLLFGWRAEGTVLHVLGGTTRFSRGWPGPGAEALVALAGPAFSLGLALGGHALAWRGALWAASMGADEAIGRAVRDTGLHVMRYNLMLGLFNLLPFALLDGGRVALAACVRWKGADIGARWAEHASLGGLILAAGWAVYARDVVFLALAIWIHVIGQREDIRERRRAKAWELASRCRPLDEARGTPFHSFHRSDGQPLYADPSGTAQPRRPPPTTRRPAWWKRFLHRRTKASDTPAADLAREEDRLLRKISDHGLGSLSPSERDLLLKAAAWRKTGQP